jgi:hypothetical protein
MKAGFMSEFSIYDSTIRDGTAKKTIACDLDSDGQILADFSAGKRICRVGVIYAHTIVWLSPSSSASWAHSLNSFKGRVIIELADGPSISVRGGDVDDDLMHMLEGYEVEDYSKLSEVERRKRSKMLSDTMKRLFDHRCMFCKSCIESDGKPYVETHHVIFLAKGGLDAPSNIAVVCPNCHAEFHHGREEKIFEMTSRFRTINPFARMSKETKYQAEKRFAHMEVG